MISSTWQCLPVGEFMRQCNWEDRPQTDGSQQADSQSLANWRCLSVQDFFARNSWSGRAVGADGSRFKIGSAVFDLTLPTGQFWQCFNWQGEPERLADEQIEQIIAHTEETIAEVKEFSLNDLSQLF